MKIAQAFGQRQSTQLDLDQPPPAPPPLRLREGRLPVDRTLAQRILAECLYEGQRPLNTHHVRVIANLMHRDQWTDGMQIHFAVLNGRWLLIDGQHRLHAVVQSGADIEFTALATECATPEEVARLYYRHDIVRRARTSADVVRATGIDDANDMNSREAQDTLAAVKMIVSGYAHTGEKMIAELRSPDALLEAASPWWPHARKYLGAVRVAERLLKRALLRQGIMSVGMMTFKYQPEKAREFWEGVARDDGLRKGDPRKTLVRYLIDAKAGGDNRATYAARAVSLTWNAFFEDRQLSLIRVFAESPVVIAGTPVGKKKTA